MAKQLDKSGRFSAGAATALLLTLFCSSVFASNGFEPECNAFENDRPAVEIPKPTLTIRIVDHGFTDSAADMKDEPTDPADEKVISPALAEVAGVTLSDSAETTAVEEDDAVPAKDLPETALTLPGVSEKEMPRFRRQMYRTDI